MVDAIWVAKAASYQASSNHHAALFTELIFNYGEEFTVEGENVVSHGNRVILSGLKSSPFRTSVSGRYCNVGLLLKPFAYSILQARSILSMEKLSEVLYEHLIVPESPEYAKVLGELNRFFGAVNIDRDLLCFDQHISAEQVKAGSIQHFSKSIATTPKSLIQRFKKVYSLTPSAYLRLKQVHHATALIQKAPRKSLTQIGLESGFYDQSHFIRVFKKHHHCSPKQFQKRVQKQ